MGKIVNLEEYRKQRASRIEASLGAARGGSKDTARKDSTAILVKLAETEQGGPEDQSGD
jgi:hypothetical protein